MIKLLTAVTLSLVTGFAVAQTNPEQELYYHPEGKKQIISVNEDYVPLAAFLQRIKYENDTFFYEPGLNINKPISFKGERYQDDAINYALSQAGYNVKRLAAYTYYVYDGEQPAILGQTEAEKYVGKPYMSLPNYLADILFIMSADRGYRMLWSPKLNREHYYFNNITEFFGEDFKEDIKYLEVIAQQQWPEIDIEVREDLKLIMVNHR